MFCPICNGECRGKECRFCAEYVADQKKRNCDEKTLKRERYLYTCSLADLVGVFLGERFKGESVIVKSSMGATYGEWEEVEDDD